MLPQEKMCAREKKWKYVLTEAGKCFYDSWDNPREIRIGESITSSAWTDGKDCVCFDRTYLKDQKFNGEGFFAVGRVLLHEVCHVDASSDAKYHDQAFYERFHHASNELYKLVGSAKLL